ncbi:uncharacterized protein ATC70_007614 [Mucor velutinosus]|uniref:Helitron helicase-like domain-containing protein n=1 Tax=Mucor velutinosus TaxID=708070 RepID=A0AAN7D436_9FUNG|nr:hypothetical protein ATC70_007614 [Mucor velutinosus]
MQPHYLGRMDVVCDGCGALHWDAARTTGQARSNNLFYSCCKKGKAILPLLQDPPEPLNMVKDAFGNDVCSKKFPKRYQPVTIVPDDGYPLYRRRMDGCSHVVRIRDDQNVYNDFHMTNEWVVAYNPFLSKRYNAHINVEVCASVQAIKYINKYIYKGSDQTTLKTTTTATTTATAGTAAMYQNDECAKYLNGRYISPCEAV